MVVTESAYLQIRPRPLLGWDHLQKGGSSVHRMSIFISPCSTDTHEFLHPLHAKLLVNWKIKSELGATLFGNPLYSRRPAFKAPFFFTSAPGRKPFALSDLRQSNGITHLTENAKTILNFDCNDAPSSFSDEVSTIHAHGAQLHVSTLE